MQERKMVQFTKLYPKLTDADVSDVEQKLGLKIPTDLREHYLNFNGGKPIQNIFNHGGDSYEIKQFLPMKYADINSSFEDTYNDLVLGNAAFPKNVIPFAIDDGGDYFVYSLNHHSYGQILFNQSDYYKDQERFLIFLAPNLKSFLASLVTDEY